MTDRLNKILIECARLRGVYPLMHRTLHEFNWFCSAVIFGAGRDPVLESDIREADARGDVDHARALRSRHAAETALNIRFGDSHYATGDDELILLAEAFIAYCREEYGDGGAIA